MNSSVDRFAQVPYRVRDALKRRDLTFEEFGLLVYLITAADFQTREVVVTVRGVMEETGWRVSDDTVRRALAALKAAGWIDYDVHERQRGPYVICLTGACTGATAATVPQLCRSETLSGAAVGEDVRQSSERAIPHRVRVRPSAREDAAAALRRDVDLEKKRLNTEADSTDAESARGLDERRRTRAISELVDSLKDADASTFDVFDKSFPEHPAQAFERTSAEVAKRAGTLDSPAAYAFECLHNWPDNWPEWQRPESSR